MSPIHCRCKGNCRQPELCRKREEETEPTPTWLSTQMRPPCPSTIFRRWPGRAPCCARPKYCGRWSAEGLKQLAAFAFRNARPLIANGNQHAAVFGQRAHLTKVPGWENLTALEIRLFSTCAIFPSSSDRVGSAPSI